MVFPLLGAAIGGIASIAGAGIAAGSASSAARASNRAQLKMNQKNLKWQKKFAKNSVQWRVRDAKKAGIHPLAALGAQVPGFSPSFEAGNGPEIRAAGGAAAGQMVSSAGQDIGRAVSAMSGPEATIAALQIRSMELQVKQQEMQNASIAADVALKTQAGTPPAYPVPGASYRIEGQNSTRNGPLIAEQPLARTGFTDTGKDPGPINDVGFIQTPGRSQFPVQSQDAKQRLEDDIVGELLWGVRNRIMGPLTSPDAYAPPGMERDKPGYVRSYDPVSGWYWAPIKKRSDDPYADAFKY